MATTVTDDSYSTPFATDLVVGQALDFQQAGTAATVTVSGWAGSLNVGTPLSFNQQGTAGFVSPTGLAGEVWQGVIVGGAVSDRAEVTVTGFAGGVSDSLAEADWSYRISLPGVVFYHDFRAAAEVDQFRENGDLLYDPTDSSVGTFGAPQNTCEHITTDGITGGGCLEITVLAGPDDCKNWYRPFVPLSSPGNGRTTDDPADNGQIALDPIGSHGPPSGTNAYNQVGNYGPESSQAESGGTWDGFQYWVSFRLKVSSGRASSLYGGKVSYFTRTENSLTAQELVTSYSRDFDPAENWRMYKQGSGQISGYIGSPLFQWDEWVTYTYHIVAGDEVDPAGLDEGGSNTRVNVYQHRDGETGYTKIFERNDLAIDYGNAFNHKAWNALILSGYFNLNSGNQNPTTFTQRFDQVIFSRQYIPPPSGFTSSTLQIAADSLVSAGNWTLDPISTPPFGSTDITWQNLTGFYDDSRQQVQVMGKGQSGAPARHYRYDEKTDLWTLVNGDVAPGQLGHAWCVSFDFTENIGDYYFIEQQPSGSLRNTIRHYDRETDSWGTLPPNNFPEGPLWWVGTDPGGSAGGNPHPGFCFHPNLLGPGRPGIYCFSNDKFAYYDVVNQSWTLVRDDLFFSGGDYANFSRQWLQNTTLYVPGLDLLMFGSGEGATFGGGPATLIVKSGDANNLNPILATLPISVNNDNDPGSAIMMLDPRDLTQKTVMLLEQGHPNTNNRVWTSNDPENSIWTPETFTHPFTKNNFPYRNVGDSSAHQDFTVCSIPRYGVVLGMASYGGGSPGQGTMLWRPGGSLVEV